MRKLFIFITSLFIVGCSNQSPNPETERDNKNDIDPIQMEYKESVPAALYTTNQTFDVYYKIEKHDILVECYIPSISFNNQTPFQDKNRAKIIAYIDDLRNSVFDSPAFIIPNVPSGTHKIQLQIDLNDEQSDSMSRSFFVTIP